MVEIIKKKGAVGLEGTYNFQLRGSREIFLDAAPNWPGWINKICSGWGGKKGINESRKHRGIHSPSGETQICWRHNIIESMKVSDIAKGKYK